MGRPRRHDERTAAALLGAAERTIGQVGPDSLSIRQLAIDTGTSTRAVYSLFGSKAGLIAALAREGFDAMRSDVDRLPRTAAPQDDLVEAGLVIRRFALDRPAVFRIIFRNTTDPYLRSRPEVQAASARALAGLNERVARAAGDPPDRSSVDDATTQFRALCDGLAALELGGTIAPESGERLWRSGLSALVRGLVGDRGPEGVGS